MALCIIDQLEIIQIQKQYRDTARMTLQCCQIFGTGAEDRYFFFLGNIPEHI